MPTLLIGGGSPTRPKPHCPQRPSFSAWHGTRLSSALVDEPTEIIDAQVGIAQDAAKGAPADFSVQRDDERVPAPRLLQADVTAALTDGFPALLAKRLDEALAGNDRLTRAHAGSGNLAANDAHVERLAVFAESLDVEDNRLVGASHRVIDIVALRMQAGEVGGVDVVAPLFLGLKYKLYLAVIGHCGLPLQAYATTKRFGDPILHPPPSQKIEFMS
jgi:hypothetical protein